MLKTFLKKCCAFIFIVVIVDVVSGNIFKCWQESVTTGSLGKENYICNHCNEQLLIFGSSRAEYHYDAKMLESLGVTVYNCGRAGDGIITSLGYLLMITKRYSPQAIILDIYPPTDLEQGLDNHRFLPKLRSHADRKNIRDLIVSIDNSERIKMVSSMYRFNSSCVRNPMRLLKNSDFDKNNIGIQGFVPQYKNFSSTVGRSRNAKPKNDLVKISCIEKFLQCCRENSISLIICISPFYEGIDKRRLMPIKEICRKEKVPFLDFSNDSHFLLKDSLFRDTEHLNCKGANLYTKLLIQEISNYKLCHIKN